MSEILVLPPGLDHSELVESIGSRSFDTQVSGSDVYGGAAPELSLVQVAWPYSEEIEEKRGYQDSENNDSRLHVHKCLYNANMMMYIIYASDKTVTCISGMKTITIRPTCMMITFSESVTGIRSM